MKPAPKKRVAVDSLETLVLIQRLLAAAEHDR